MSTFTVHDVSCDHCSGTGKLSDDRAPQSPRVRRCLDCAEGVSGWEVRENADRARARLVDRLHRDLGVPESRARCSVVYRSGGSSGWRVTVTRMSDGMNATSFLADPVMIGVLPALGTIDRESARAFADSLECVPGREVEALEEFARTEAYPDFLIEALGSALAGDTEIPERPRAGVRS